MMPETAAAIKRDQYYRSLAEVIEEWQSDPKGYDLRLVAHELQKMTGSPDPRPMKLPPGEFIALLGRCKRRGANPSAPVPPTGALEWRRQLRKHLLEEEGVLLAGRPLFAVAAAFRGPWPTEWHPVAAAGPGDATSQAVMFDRPEAPEGELLRIAAEMGPVPDSGGQRLWYRIYYQVRWYMQVEVQILAEGTTTTVSAARAAVGRKFSWFLREQCEAEPLPDEPPPPPRTEVYFVQVPVRLNAHDVTELSKGSHQAELSAVVSGAVRRYAKRVKKLRDERSAARRAAQSKKEARKEPHG